MPIQFRCHQCRQVLSITSKKAGTLVACPSCREQTRVPTMEEVEAAIAAKGSQGTKPSRKESPKSKPATEATSAATQPPTPADASRPSQTPTDRVVDVARRPLPSEATPASEEAPATAAAAPTGPEEGHELWEHAAEERNPWLDEEADADEEFQLNRRPLDEGGLDMTPMVDVTFLLLIFFMITAAFSIQKSMQAEPPQPEDEGAAQTMTIEEMEQDSVVVGISDEDELTIDDEPIGGLGALEAALQAKAAESGGEMEMTIEADPRCSFGIMVGVMDTGITVGMQRIRRISRPIDE